MAYGELLTVVNSDLKTPLNTLFKRMRTLVASHTEIYASIKHSARIDFYEGGESHTYKFPTKITADCDGSFFIKTYIVRKQANIGLNVRFLKNGNVLDVLTFEPSVGDIEISHKLDFEIDDVIEIEVDAYASGSVSYAYVMLSDFALYGVVKDRVLTIENTEEGGTQ
jgi:hypothetical protein